jgi:hypothetical protein|uniref:Uncharacterized protein n=1 Tax=viral metagenome TaxID=1070528 RepID=A0A6C0D189_9ZZZZ
MNIQLTAKYNKQSLFHAISIYNFSQHESISNILKAVRFLYQYRHHESRLCPSLQQLNNKLIELFNTYKNSENYEIHEIIDIIIEYVPNGRQYLDELRRIQTENSRQQRELAQQIQRQTTYKNIDKTIYSDRQNVHASSINNTVKNAAKLLVDKYYNNIYNIEDIKKLLIEKYNNDSISKVLDRISGDIANFNINISLRQVFISLWNWIHITHDLQEISELERILVDEITDMNEMCASGHLSRLINVTQGFTDEFIINISNMDQCNAVIRYYLNKRLEECTDEKVIDGMITRDEYYLNFIQTCIDEKIDYFRTEYGDEFIQNLKSVVSKF